MQDLQVILFPAGRIVKSAAERWALKSCGTPITEHIQGRVSSIQDQGP